ncbi:MAG: hypothetical protein KAY37_06915 [Phycisphaerae bacterium]|nr:hypothetical protein [Phycisphaerae bacterium]
MPRKRPTRRVPARTRRLIVGLTLCGLVLATPLALGLAATCRPTWYRPASIDRARLRDDKRELVNLLDRIGAALNERRRINFQLQEDQVNRWIVARAEMWPEAAIDLGPLQHPQVSFLDDGVRIAALMEQHGLRAVISVTFRVDVTIDEIRINYDSARLGALPVPRGWLSDWMAQMPIADHVIRDSGPDGTIVLQNDWIWPNGKRRYRVADLRISAGQANVVLEPLPGGP